MQLSVEILDYIFSFLVSHRETIVACSKDPILSPIVERHLFHHLIVTIIGTPDSDNPMEPDHLSKVVSEKPRILYYVRILEIQVESKFMEQPGGNYVVREELDKFAKTLLMFPVLECIMLKPSKGCVWCWPDVFRAALEDRLNLPTVTEVHLIGGQNFPSSILDNCKGVTNLTLSSIELFEVTKSRVSHPTLPRLESLTLAAYSVSGSLLAWLKRHITELQSFRCVNLRNEVLSELLGECSRTLVKLEMYLGIRQYTTRYSFRTGAIQTPHFPEFPKIPRNLEQLIIHIGAAIHGDEGGGVYISSLLTAAKVIQLFTPSLLHLVLEIDLSLPTSFDFTKVDLSPLTLLGAASLSIPHIDLFVFTKSLPPALTRTQFISSLGNDEDMQRSIEDGRLVIQWEEGRV